MSRVIGLTGRKRAGKDTVGGYLYHEVHAHLDAFAAPMKAALATIFNVPVTLFDDPEMKEIPLVQLLGRSPRHVMQTLGTEWGAGRTYSTICGLGCCTAASRSRYVRGAATL